MKASALLRPLAASTLLFAAACGGSGPANDAGNAAPADEALDNFAGLPPEDAAGNEVELVGLPPAPAGAPAADTAPLAQAAQIADEIEGGTGVERVPFEGGWAWRRDGRIVRTASRDGRRVSYFRPGESAPFLVQQGDETFAYQGGRPQRAFDRRGRAAAVPPQRQAEARRLVDQSTRERGQAEQAPRRPENDSAGPTRGDDRPGRGRGRDDAAGDDRGDRGRSADNRVRGADNQVRGADDRVRGTGNRIRGAEDRGPGDRRGRGADDHGNRQ